MLILDRSDGLKSMLRQVSSFVGGVAEPVDRIFSAFAALQELIINLETDERSALAVFAYGNHHAHAPDSTLPPNGNQRVSSIRHEHPSKPGYR